MIRISISGTHCTGKTTFLEELKKIEKDFIFIDGPTRQLKDQGFPINNNQSLNYDSTQLMCCYLDLENLKLKLQGHQVLISDRCLLDTLVYTQFLYQEGKVTLPVFLLIKTLWELHQDRYDLIILPEKKDISLVGDEYRNTDAFFREIIDSIFYEILKDSRISYQTISGSNSDRIKEFQIKVKQYNETNN